VEIKIDSTPEVALNQIDEKGYAVPYMAGEQAVYKVGVAFSTCKKRAQMENIHERSKKHFSAGNRE
jgi:hypothetical protein